ncbi:MAG: hypothetical protein WA488_29435 [Mycobacterium sp.]|uniref:hypothetical protein n=1 Tax=Mycobacterium sp. TaxID=1785 RepID=UPI003BD97988
MGTLRAATHELHTTASGWQTLAGEVTVTAPSVSGLSFQPSAAAVTAIHAAVATASGTLTARTLMTATKTTSAATAYTNNEATSSDRLYALSGSM